MAATAEYVSSSHPSSKDVASCEIGAGADIDGAEHAPSTPLHDSKTGASFVIIAGAAHS